VVQSGVYGAPMTGGGFEGAAINLVEASSAEAFAESAANCIRKKPASSRRVTSACRPMVAARLSKAKFPCRVSRP
jgi:galactokinase